MIAKLNLFGPMSSRDDREVKAMSRSLLEVGIAGTALEGGTKSGDLPILCPFDGGVLVGVLDGLGHGPEAFDSARIASSMIEEHAGDPIVSLFSRCHERLRLARGVSMSLASFRDEELSMSWAGVGDVEGILIREHTLGASCEFLLRKAGVVGDHLPQVAESIVSVAEGDLLLFLTDGIHKDALRAVSRDLSSQEIADRILRHHRKATDDALVLVARYRGALRPAGRDSHSEGAPGAREGDIGSHCQEDKNVASHPARR